MGSGGTEWEVADVISASRMNQKTLFVGTGSQINAITTYAGMMVYCTSDGNDFYADSYYRRNAANNAWDALATPTGSMMIWAGAYNAIPAGWKICDGSAISRTTYARLFAAISTRFGTGDGSTTFNIPDMRAKFPRGAPNATQPGGTGGEDTHTLSSGEMPSHTHTQDSHGHTLSQSGIGRVRGNADDASSGFASGTQNGTLLTTVLSLASTVATNQNTGGGGSHENRPAYVELVYIIKT